ncbi:MAG: phenylalanine--tRNA ligase beta subunit [Planctomycetota bacterium]|nr:MAG: phenylalanine--tRNA ligase beta subunit [Planctomycetota bacterium]
MFLSLSWLKDHVDLEGLSPETIGHELTMRTALIEGLVDQRVGLSGVVVGDVVECGPHPGADRLKLCRVDHGAGELASVVCGAPNVEAGQKILYAPVGTSLPNGMKLKKAKIRGEASAGMICAEDELGLGPEHDGILVLDAALEPGRPIAELNGFADVLFDIDNKSITHRPDLWGHYGFARELAAIFGRELKPLALRDDLKPAASAPILQLASDGGCSRYAALCIDDTPGRAPDWMRFRLVSCGMRPINRLVDLSNYVMLELGQPTHPFDRDRVAADTLGVRSARVGEQLTTLDGELRELHDQDIVIVDGEKIVAIGGIMGGAHAEVSDSTQRVLLESACFDPVRTRRTSSRLGLRTDALARFEKDLDPALAELAVRRYAWWLGELSPEAVIHSDYALAGEGTAPQRRLALDPAMVSRRLGMPVTSHEVQDALGSVGFKCAESSDTPGQLDVDVPSWRATRDVTLPEDLVEEVGRLIGYDRVPDQSPSARLVLGQRDPLPALEDALRSALAGSAGFTEVYHYSTVSDRALELMGWTDDGQRPVLSNPLQKDASRLRPALAPAMLEQLEAWLRHGERVRTFEVGRGYRVVDGEMRESRELVALLASRDALDARDVVRELRGVAEGLLQAVGRRAPDLERVAPRAGEPWFHAQRTAVLLRADRELGRLGAVSPEVLTRLDVQGAAGLLVLDLDALVADEPARSNYRPVTRMPEARYDLTFVLDYDLPVSTLLAAIRSPSEKKLAKRLRHLKDAQAFDVYRGPPQSAEQRAVSVRLVFQAEDRTLKAEELAKAVDAITVVAADLGATLPANSSASASES